MEGGRPRGGEKHDAETAPWDKSGPEAAGSAPDVLLATWGRQSASIVLPDQGSLLVGRGHGVHFFIADDAISRVHAMIEIVAPLVTIVDRDSRHGVVVNGRRLAVGERASIGSGECVELGPVRLKVYRECAFECEPPPGDAVWEAVPGAVVTRSPIVAQTQREIEHLGTKNVTVLILGESGTGKERAAKTIHAVSKRAKGPFVAVNMAEIPQSLVESVLFGHVKGAFTGATETRKGLIELASGGTLFIDEVGDIPPELQVKLLRVIQERVIRPVGSDGTVSVDVRVVSATHRDLEGMVRAGTFRADLYHRLRVAPITLHPMRERRCDILLFAERFLRDACETEGVPVMRITDAARAALEAHDWPGNIREIENAMISAAARTMEGVVDARHLFLGGTSGAAGRAPAAGLGIGRRQKERDEIVARKLEACGGNRTQAARELGVSRGLVLRVVEKLGLGRRGGKNEG